MSGLPWTGGARTLVLAAGALTLRVALLGLSPRFGYFADHEELVRFGLMAADKGVLSLYDEPPESATARIFRGGDAVLVRRDFRRVFNYPPGLAYPLAVSGRLFSALAPDRLINTFLSRFLFGFWGLIADLFTAWGGARLARRLGGEEAGRGAFTLLLFAPPLVWGCVGWGQMDAPVIAVAVWMVLALVENRFLAAGVLFGILLALKPQALFFAPFWALSLAAGRPRIRPASGLLAAALTLGAVALPFSLHGGLAWARASYLGNFSRIAEGTTLKAFNVWYLDSLISGSLDPRTPVLGLAKMTWGVLLVAAALAALFVSSVRRRAATPREILLHVATSLLLVVMLPTGIHERFIQIPLAFLLIASAVWSRLVPGVLCLTTVAFAQLTWPLWLHPAGLRPFEWGFTLLALVGAGLTIADALELQFGAIPPLPPAPTGTASPVP